MAREVRNQKFNKTPFGTYYTHQTTS
ncbi:uncharacterized protein METZ01_LOCUS126185 [marine metagenome]|uniref:Uncharacterized protein n=1 Tax=marine metagenome TaxID=408172 RepID=A0A381Y9P5_9ZZZZ